MLGMSAPPWGKSGTVSGGFHLLSGRFRPFVGSGGRMKFLDRNDPFFRKMWVRVVTVALPLGWGAVELATGNPGWALMFGAAGAWALYELFLRAAD